MGSWADKQDLLSGGARVTTRYKAVSATARYKIRYRIVGTTEWTYKIITSTAKQRSDTGILGTIGATGISRGAVSLVSSIQFPTPDQYEVGIQLVHMPQEATKTLANPRVTAYTQITKDIPTVTITSNIADQVAFGVTFPRGIYYANDSGGMSTHTISVKVEYKRVGSTVWFGQKFNISGNTTRPIRRLFHFKNLPEGQYEMRAYIVSKLRGTARYGEDTYLEYIQYGIKDDMTYPGTSLLAVQALATDQLSGSFPKVSLEFASLLIGVKIDGVWTPCDMTNPAWAAYYMIVRPYVLDNLDVEVLGEDPDTIDMEAFLEWADWCEKQQLECNTYIDQVMNLDSALNMIATCGRGHVFQKGSQWSVLIDRPTSPTMTFNMGNMIANTFKQNFIGTDDIVNTIEIQYFDRKTNYSRQTVEIRSDDFDTTDQPTRKETITLYGCTSRNQAIRYAKSLLNQNKYLRRTINFEAHIDAIGVTVGDVIRVSHDVPQWGFSGRALAGGTKSIILDREVTVKAGTPNKIMVKNSQTDELVIRDVVPPETDTVTNALEVTEEFGFIPAQYDLYNFGHNTPDKLFRVISITRAQEFTRRITALEYRDELYDDFVEIPEYTQESDLGVVTNLRAREEWVLGFDGTPTSNVVLTWEGNSSAWYVYYRRLGEERFSEWEFTRNKTSVISGLIIGTAYEFRVSRTQDTTDSLETSLTLRGKEAAPSDVENFSASFYRDNVQFSWDHIPDIDLWGYEIRQGVSWDNGIQILRLEQKNKGEWHPPFDGTYQFWIKSIDTSNNYSINANSLIMSLDVEKELNIVSEIDEINDTAQAVLDHLVFCADNNRIYYTPSMIAADCPNLDVSVYQDQTNTVATYTSKVYDLSTSISAEYRMGWENTSFVDSGLVNAANSPDVSALTHPRSNGIILNTEERITPYIRSSLDNVTFTNWIRYTAPVGITARYYQLKWVVELQTSATRFYFSSLRHIVDAPDQLHRLPNTPIEASGYEASLDALGISIIREYVVNVTVRGSLPIYPTVEYTGNVFRINLFDANGNAVAGVADVTITGF